MLDRGGVSGKREQSHNTKELGDTIYIDLAPEEKHYSEDECLDYEREYFPLQCFKNSWEQPQLSGESKWDVSDWGHSTKEDALEEEEESMGHVIPQPLGKSIGRESELSTLAWETAVAAERLRFKIKTINRKGRTGKQQILRKSIMKTMRETTIDTRLDIRHTWNTWNNCMKSNP